MNSVRRRSSITWLSVTICLPITIATRSTTAADADERSKNSAAGKVRIRFNRMLESLSDGEEILDVADALDRLRRAAEKKLIISTLQTVERGWIDAVGEIDQNWTQRRAVANPETDRVHHVIEIGQAVLMHTERHAAQSCINVTHVMEENSRN